MRQNSRSPNLALTPQVISRTPDAVDPVQPTTENVLKRPLLIIPPGSTNLILDLNPEKSFIKWCVDTG